MCLHMSIHLFKFCSQSRLTGLNAQRHVNKVSDPKKSVKIFLINIFKYILSEPRLTGQASHRIASLHSLLRTGKRILFAQTLVDAAGRSDVYPTRQNYIGIVFKKRDFF